jgi:hypothetical protein
MAQLFFSVKLHLLPTAGLYTEGVAWSLGDFEAFDHAGSGARFGQHRDMESLPAWLVDGGVKRGLCAHGQGQGSPKPLS